ncbi:hypothetical protein G7074_02470 [Pedobacter sp. HDW13]|uniref:hypothetical protein n=1 Tax=unclassified Pedobacter TaxID=2628915 RepID=UPI000F59E636|nr:MULTISPECIES: hypothetical protein [unclassified Pedobacter]QIL38241.1 hypothetical protein G7074_02470 [Pedobacter sp. HDW13]RQO73676.1 hypothetical protein DBR40_12730 [Pedobacter sp. KBW01]
MVRISFSKLSFDEFTNCPLDKLEEEILRYSIRMKLQNSPQTPEERESYRAEIDRLTVLKYISQLRKGKITIEDFNLKVALNKGLHNQL